MVGMKKVLAFSLLTLAVLVGSASADRGRHRGHYKSHHRGDASGGVVVRTAPVRVTPYRTNSYRTSYRRDRYRNHVRVVRRPIFVKRPTITVRYYNYNRRPTLIAENYDPMVGYYWVRGQWTWTGYEWMWQPGHYEPDPNYVEPDYYDGYNGYNGYDGYNGY